MVQNELTCQELKYMNAIEYVSRVSCHHIKYHGIIPVQTPWVHHQYGLGRYRRGCLAMMHMPLTNSGKRPNTVCSQVSWNIPFED